MHELDKMKRAQAQQVDEMMIQKLRENHETIQQLTSQLQQMQEQMNSMNSSGEFQDIESMCSGRLSHVSIQLEIIPSSRALLSRDKRLPLDTWESIRSTVKRFWKSIFYVWFTSRFSSKNFIYGTIPMPTFASRPLTTSSTLPVELPQNNVVGQQRKQMSELQFDKFPAPASFMVWKTRFQTQVSNGSDFPLAGMLWIQEVDMVDSLDVLKSSRSVVGKDFSKFWDAGREDCLDSEQDHPEFPVQKGGQPRGTESSERGPVPKRKTCRLHELMQLSSDWRSWHSIGLCWFILCHSSWWQHSGVRYTWNLGKSVKIEDTWVWSTQNRIRIVRHGDSSKDIGQKLKTHGKEEKRSEASFTKLWRQAWENWIRSRGKESKGNLCCWRRKRYLLPVERKRPVFARRPLQFPPRNPRSCAKSRTHCRHTFRASPSHEVEVCQRREACEAKVTMDPFFDNRVNIIWKGTCTRMPCEYWHPPECQFYKTKTGCKSGDKCLFPH